MKDKVLNLIIGILIGAIIASAGFLIYSKTHEDSSNANSSSQQMPRDGNGQPPSMDGKGMGGGNGQPPSKPGESSDSNNTSEPPAKPDESNDNSQNSSNTTSSNSNSNNSSNSL